MFGGLVRITSYQILNELQKGKKTFDEVKNVTTAYGAVFDFALSSLLTYGLVRKVSEEGKEYLELTDLGKSALSGLFYMGPPYVRPGLWYGGRRHHHGWWW